MNRSVYNLLLRSFDSPRSREERRKLEASLNESEELRSSKQELTALRRTLELSRESSFAPFFVERVLARLHKREESVDEYFVSVFRTLATGAAVLVILLSVYNISRLNALSIESAFGISHPSLEQVLMLEAPFE